MATHSSILTWEIPIDQGAWWATVHGVTKSQTPGTDRLSTSTHTDYSRTDTLNGGWEWTLSPRKPQNRSIPLSLKEYSRVHGETKVSQGFYHNMAHRIDLRQQESTLITEALYNQSVQPQQKHYKGTFMKPSLPLRFFWHMMIHAFYFRSLVKQWLSIAEVSRMYAYFMVHFMRLI